MSSPQTDRFSGILAKPIGTVFKPDKRLLDLMQQILDPSAVDSIERPVSVCAGLVRPVPFMHALVGFDSG